MGVSLNKQIQNMYGGQNVVGGSIPNVQSHHTRNAAGVQFGGVAGSLSKTADYDNNIASHTASQIVGKLNIGKNNFTKTMTGTFGGASEKKEGSAKPKGQRSHSNNIPGQSYNDETKKTKGTHGRLQSSGAGSNQGSIIYAQKKDNHQSMDQIQVLNKVNGTPLQNQNQRRMSPKLQTQLLSQGQANTQGSLNARAKSGGGSSKLQNAGTTQTFGTGSAYDLYAQTQTGPAAPASGANATVVHPNMNNKIPLRVNKKAHHGISMNQQQLGNHNLRPSGQGAGGNSRNSGLQEAPNPYSHNYQRNRNLTMHNGLGSAGDSAGNNLIFNTTNDIFQNASNSYTQPPKPPAQPKAGHSASQSAFQGDSRPALQQKKASVAESD